MAGFYPFGLFQTAALSLPVARRVVKCLTPGACALYLYNEGTGQTLTDYSAHGNNGTLGTTAGADTNDPAWGPAGLTFGGDDLVMVGPVTVGGTVQNLGTLEVIFSIAAPAAPDSAINAILNFTEYSTGTLGYLALGEISGVLPGELVTLLTQINGTNHIAKWIDTAGTVPAGWNHLALRWNGVGYDIFLNGAQKPATLSQAPRAQPPCSNLVLGARKTGSSTYGYFVGGLAATALYPTGLTDAQLVQNAGAWRALLAPRGVVLP